MTRCIEDNAIISEEEAKEVGRPRESYLMSKICKIKGRPRVFAVPPWKETAGKRKCIPSHPSRKNKNAARVGHPAKGTGRAVGIWEATEIFRGFNGIFLLKRCTYKYTERTEIRVQMAFINRFSKVNKAIYGAKKQPLQAGR